VKEILPPKPDRAGPPYDPDALFASAVAIFSPDYKALVRTVIAVLEKGGFEHLTIEQAREKREEVLALVSEKKRVTGEYFLAVIENRWPDTNRRREVKVAKKRVVEARLEMKLLLVIRMITKSKGPDEIVKTFISNWLKDEKITLKQARDKKDEVAWSKIPTTGRGQLPMLRAALLCALTDRDYKFQGDVCGIRIVGNVRGTQGNGSEKTSKPNNSKPVSCHGNELIGAVVARNCIGFDTVHNLAMLKNICADLFGNSEATCQQVFDNRDKINPNSLPSHDEWPEAIRIMQNLQIIGSATPAKVATNQPGGEKKVAQLTEITKDTRFTRAMGLLRGNAFWAQDARTRLIAAGISPDISVGEALTTHLAAVEKAYEKSYKAKESVAKLKEMVEKGGTISVGKAKKKKKEKSAKSEKPTTLPTVPSSEPPTEPAGEKKKVKYPAGMKVSEVISQEISTGAARDIRKDWEEAGLDRNIRVGDLRKKGKRKYLAALKSELRKQQVKDVLKDVEITKGQPGGRSAAGAVPAKKKAGTAQKPGDDKGIKGLTLRELLTEVSRMKDGVDVATLNLSTTAEKLNELASFCLREAEKGNAVSAGLIALREKVEQAIKGVEGIAGGE